MENREFYRPAVPSFPLNESTKIEITQLSGETSIQTWPPGFKTTNEITRHTFFEEVYILEGALTDLSLNQAFGQGHYAWRNPQMNHGPYEADRSLGCQMIVIARQPNRQFDADQSIFQ